MPALNWLRSLFAWRDVQERGVYLYQQNEITGARRAIRIWRGGHSPIAQAWLNGGEFDDGRNRPPPPAAMRRAAY